MTKKRQQSASKKKAKRKPTAALAPTVVVDPEPKTKPPPPPPPPPRQEPEVSDVEIAFDDKNGEIANIIDGSFGHLAVIHSVEGAVRGNHYHKEDKQWIYVARGRMATRAVDPVTEEKWSYMVEEGQLEYMPPGIAHAYWFPKDTIFLNITPRPRDPKIQDQTIPWKVWDGPPGKSM